MKKWVSGYRKKSAKTSHFGSEMPSRLVKNYTITSLEGFSNAKKKIKIDNLDTCIATVKMEQNGLAQGSTVLHYTAFEMQNPSRKVKSSSHLRKWLKIKLP